MYGSNYTLYYVLCERNGDARKKVDMLNFMKLWKTRILVINVEAKSGGIVLKAALSTGGAIVWQ